MMAKYRTDDIAARAARAIASVPIGAAPGTAGTVYFDRNTTLAAADDDGDVVCRVASVRSFDPCGRYHGGASKFPKRCQDRWRSLSAQAASHGLSVRTIYRYNPDDAGIFLYRPATATR